MDFDPGTQFDTPEEMQSAYNQFWCDIASLFDDIPSCFEEALNFAAENPVAIIVISLFLVLIAFYFVRSIISGLSR